MSETMHEECGIAAVYQLDHTSADPINVSQYIPGLLLDLQNRGQLSAGMTSYDPKHNLLLKTHKDVGTVDRVFRLFSSQKHRNLVRKYEGTVAIGHVRYATSGAEDRNFAQPFERIHGRKWKWFSIGFNGNLANFEELKAALVERGYHISYNTDTEVMMHHINKELSGELRSFKEIFASLAKSFDGAFNIVFLNARGELIAMRDPLGIKPLCYGIKNNLLFVASESVALARLGITDYQDLEPGSLLVATPHDGYRIERYSEVKRTAHCQFEWVYFANLASNLDGRSVFKARRLMGRLLAEMEDIPGGPDARVVPVPETAKVAGDGFGFKLGIPVIEGLVRNRYVGRTFIEGQSRQDVILRKFTPLVELLENKRIFLVDDSLVRSTTLSTIIELIRERGRAKEIHVRIACPSIIAPCFYGIDIPTVKELFVPRFWKPGQPLTHSKETLAEMAEAIGADSLKFLTIDRLSKAIGHSKEQLCTACIDTTYPTLIGEKRYQEQIKHTEVEADSTQEA